MLVLPGCVQLRLLALALLHLLSKLIGELGYLAKLGFH